MKELAEHAPPRYEFGPLSLDDLGETFERGRALESTTYAQMLSLRRLHYKGYRRLQQACSPTSAKEMKNMPSPIPDVVAWVGLDWADQQHHGRLQAVGSSHVESFVLPQRPAALQDWVCQLRTRFPLGRVAIALEQSRGPLVYALMNYDFLLLYPVPPKSLADYRKAFFSSGAKSDPEDADLLLELVRCHADRLRVWQPEDAQTRQIQMLAEQRRKLVHDRTRLTNRLTGLLKDAFPQALEWAGELGTARACEFLRRWPSLEYLQRTRRSQVRHFYLQQGWKDPATLEQRLEQIRQAQPLTSDPAVLQVSALMVELPGERRWRDSAAALPRASPPRSRFRLRHLPASPRRQQQAQGQFRRPRLDCHASRAPRRAPGRLLHSPRRQTHPCTPGAPRPDGVFEFANFLWIERVPHLSAFPLGKLGV